ncbi:hypothetical protein M436DRAFT_16524, partial [Aureobasidium namibiae CBS 147.97]
ISLACAAPRPQDINFSLADALPDPTYSEAVGVTAQVITYDASAVLSSAASQITASVADTAAAVVATTDAPSNQKRDACAAQQAQPSGYGPVPAPDTPSAFLSYSSFVAAATGAPVPSGYTQQFSNLQASSGAYGYLGFYTLQTYDTNACATKCNAVSGCVSFNLYFERDPTVNPGGDCLNPPSTTTIKCALWGGPVTAGNTVNTGQPRGQFVVVIAGSNGYLSNAVASVPGYGPAQPYGNNAINAPYDQNGYNTFLGSAIFQGAFNAELCAAACTQKSDYARAHPPTDGTPVQTCQFFNTYILYKNTPDNVQGQYCAMYAESWGPSFATNNGQYRGNDHFMIQYSFEYSNSTNPGSPNPVAAVYQARQDILWPGNSAQPFCSSILGYTTPVATTVSVTNVAATVTATSVSTYFTTVSTVVNAKRDGGASPAPTSWTIINGVALLALPSIPLSSTQAPQKRAVSTPNVLTKYPASIITSACSLAASPVTTSVTTLITSSVTVGATTTVTDVVTSTCTPAYKFVAASGTYAGQYIT